MKKLLSLLLAVACVFAALPAIMMPNVSAYLQEDEDRRYARYIGKEKINIDGVLDEEFYGANDKSDWYKFMLPLDGEKDEDAFYYDDYALYNIIRFGNENFDVLDQLGGGNQWWMNPCDNFSILLNPNEEFNSEPLDSQFMMYILVAYSDDNDHQADLFLSKCGKQVTKLSTLYQVEIASNVALEDISEEDENGNITLVPGQYKLPNGTWDVEVKVPFELLNHPHSADAPDSVPLNIRPYKTIIGHAIWYREVKDGVAGVWNDSKKPSYVSGYSAMGAMHNPFNHSPIYFMKSDGTEGPGTEPNPPVIVDEREIVEDGEAESKTARPDYSAIDVNTKAVDLDGVITTGEYQFVENKGFIAQGATYDASYEGSDVSKYTNVAEGKKIYSNDKYSYAYDENYLYMAVQTGDTKITRKDADSLATENTDYVILSVDPKAEYQSNINRSSNGIKIAVYPSVYNKDGNVDAPSGEYEPIDENNVAFLEQGIDVKVVGDVDLSNKATGIKVADNASQVSATNPWAVEVAIPWKYIKYTAKNSDKLNMVKKHEMQFQAMTYNFIPGKTDITGNGVSEGNVISAAENGVYKFKFTSGISTTDIQEDKVVYQMNEDAILEKTNDLEQVFDAEDKNTVEVILPLNVGFNRKGYTTYSVDFGKDAPVAKFNSSLFTKDWINSRDGNKGSTIEVTDKDKVKVVAHLITAKDIADEKTKANAIAVYGEDQKLIKYETYIIDEFGNETNVVPSANLNAEFNIDLEKYPVSETERNGAFPVIFNPQGVQVSNVAAKYYVDETLKFTEDADGNLNTEIVKAYRYIGRYADNPIIGLGKFEEVEFTDLKAKEDKEPNTWYIPVIKQFSRTGIIKGQLEKDADGNDVFNYNAESPITREQAIWLMGLVFSISTNTNGIEKFPDVSDQSYAKDVIQAMKALGIAKGDDYGNFKPSSNITRREFVTLFARSLEYTNVELPVKYPTDEIYASIGTMKDKNDILKSGSSWSWDAIEYLISNKIMNGDQNGNFNPDMPITRAEATKIFNSYLNFYVIRSEIAK